MDVEWVLIAGYSSGMFLFGWKKYFDVKSRNEKHSVWWIDPRGGQSHYGGDADVRLQRPPIFSVAVSQWPHIFADCLCYHPKSPHFLVKCGLFDRSHPKTPYILHLAVTWSYFLFQFHQQIDHFCHFDIFLKKFLLLKRSLKDQK